MAALPGCELLVEFDRSKIPQEGGVDATTGDAQPGMDAMPETSAPDSMMVVDSAGDVVGDAGTDGTTDSAADAPGDTGPAMDTGVDTGAVMDSAATMDSAADTGSGMDAASDAATDAADAGD
jgi:hypothetical protein